MSIWKGMSDVLNGAELAVFGEPIVYRGAKGAGAPIDAVGIPDRSGITQSTAPGYFLDMMVDPSAIRNPAQGDEIDFGGVTYVVGPRIVRADIYAFTILPLHRKLDT